jgi:hypothetical protein
VVPALGVQLGIETNDKCCRGQYCIGLVYQVLSCFYSCFELCSNQSKVGLDCITEFPANCPSYVGSVEDLVVVALNNLFFQCHLWTVLSYSLLIPLDKTSKPLSSRNLLTSGCNLITWVTSGVFKHQAGNQHYSVWILLPVPEML